MKTTTKLSLALIVGALFAFRPSAAQAQENASVTGTVADTVKMDPLKEEEHASPKSLSASGDAGYYSRYISNGLEFSEGVVMQTNVSVAYGGLKLNSFMNSEYKYRELNEFDTQLSYSQDIPGFGEAHIAFTYLTFPYTEMGRSREINAGIELPAGPLTSKIDVFRDFDQGNGTATMLGLSYDMDSAPLTFNAELGYNNHYWRQTRGFSHAGISVEAELELNDFMTVTPKLGCNHAFDKRESESGSEIATHIPLYDGFFFNVAMSFNN